MAPLLPHSTHAIPCQSGLALGGKTMGSERCGTAVPISQKGNKMSAFLHFYAGVQFSAPTDRASSWAVCQMAWSCPTHRTAPPTPASPASKAHPSAQMAQTVARILSGTRSPCPPRSPISLPKETFPPIFEQSRIHNVACSAYSTIPSTTSYPAQQLQQDRTRTRASLQGGL